MRAIPAYKLPWAGTLLVFIRVVEKETNPFIVASAYIIAEDAAKELDVQGVMPKLRDAVMWTMMEFSGFTYKTYRETVCVAFGCDWSLTLHSQLMKQQPT